MAPRPAPEVNDWQTAKGDPGDWQTVGASPTPEPPKSPLDHLENAAKNFWAQLSNAGAGMVNMVTSNPLKTLKGIGESQDALRQKAADALKRGDIVEAARHALSYAIPVAGPAIDALGDQAQSGDVSGALGGATAVGLMGAAPGALEHPAVAPALETAGTAIKGAAKGAAQAAVEPINYGHLRIPVPAPIAGAGAGGYAAGQLGIPHPVGAVIGASVPIVRGAIRGAKAALADRIATAVDSISASPGELLARAQGQDWATLSAGDRALLEQVANAQKNSAFQPSAVSRETPLTIQPPPEGGYQPNGPSISAADMLRAQIEARKGMAQAPVPAPVPAQPITIQEPPAAGYAPRSLAQVEAAMAQKGPPPTEAPRSLYNASGDLKSPQLRAAEITGQNIQDKAARFVQALHDAGVTAAEARAIPVGRLSISQIQQGGIPGWGNITDSLVEKGILKPGENPPSQSIPHIVTGLKKLEAAKIAQQLADEMRKSGTIK